MKASDGNRSRGVSGSEMALRRAGWFWLLGPHTDRTCCLVAWQSIKGIGLLNRATMSCSWRPLLSGCQSAAGPQALLLAERRNALSTLDYALASGANDAASTRTEVDAAMKRTAEEVVL